MTARVLDIGKGPRDKRPDVIPARGLGEFASLLARFSADGWLIHLHTSGNNAKSYLVAAAAGVALRPSPGRVVTLHSGSLPAFLEEAYHHRVVAHAALRGYARIVAVSEAVRDAVLSLDVPPHRVVMHPAFCASQVVCSEAPHRLRWLFQHRSPVLAYAHHPSKVYGRQVLFEALARLRKRLPHLGLAMFGVETGSAAVREDARKAGVEDLVEDLGELPHWEALALMEHASAFVRPTTVDGDAITVREALALGTPCVASDASARPEGTLVFRAGDAGDLADKLYQAFQGPRRVVRGPDAAEFLLQLYEEIMRDAPRRAVASDASREAHG
ncbi:MAG TPA: glycosyltransferase [Myxococcales bacterium]|nr:glycosyltransferase [Myxococcales bacterium]